MYYLTGMVHVTRTNSESSDFLDLVKLLDADLANRYGEAQTFFDQFNKLNHIRNVVVAYRDGHPVGCGAFKPYSASEVEIKRMFVATPFRGQGIAVIVLRELEKWAIELGYDHAILETGSAQLEAIQLYTKQGYSRIENYGQYEGVELSICMKKKLT
jgi:putative acetyltransferase